MYRGLLLFSRVSGVYWGRGLVMMELEFCLDRGFPGVRETPDTAVTRREAGRHSTPTLEEERIGKSQWINLTPIISNSNLLSMWKFLNICMYVCVKTTKIYIHSQITNWAENEWLLVNNMNLLGIPKIHQLML